MVPPCTILYRHSRVQWLQHIDSCNRQHVNISARKYKNVNMPWLRCIQTLHFEREVSEEFPGSSDLTVTLQWEELLIQNVQTCHWKKNKATKVTFVALVCIFMCYLQVKVLALNFNFYRVLGSREQFWDYKKSIFELNLFLNIFRVWSNIYMTNKYIFHRFYISFQKTKTYYIPHYKHHKVISELIVNKDVFMNKAWMTLSPEDCPHYPLLLLVFPSPQSIKGEGETRRWSSPWITITFTTRRFVACLLQQPPITQVSLFRRQNSQT